MNEINWKLFSEKLDRLSLNYTIDNNSIPLTINGAKIKFKEKLFWIYIPLLLEIALLSVIPFFFIMLSESNIESIRIPTYFIVVIYVSPLVWLFSGVKIIYKKKKGNRYSKTFQKNLVTITSKNEILKLKKDDFVFYTQISQKGQDIFLGELFIQLQNNELIPILVLYDENEQYLQDDIKFFVNVLNLIL